MRTKGKILSDFYSTPILSPLEEGAFGVMEGSKLYAGSEANSSQTSCYVLVIARSAIAQSLFFFF